MQEFLQDPSVYWFHCWSLSGNRTAAAHSADWEQRGCKSPSTCSGPPLAVTTRLQEPEDTVSVSFQRNPRGDSAETLGHMGAWTAGQAGPSPPGIRTVKIDTILICLGVVLSVLRTAGRADWTGFSGSSCKADSLSWSLAPRPQMVGHIPSATGRLCDLEQVTLPLQAPGDQEEQSRPCRQTGGLHEIILDDREPGTQKTFTEHLLYTQISLRDTKAEYTVQWSRGSRPPRLQKRM